LDYYEDQLKVCQTKQYNLQRTDPRLSLHMRKQVKQEHLTLKEAVDAELKSNEERMAELKASIHQVASEKSQAHTIRQIQQTTEATTQMPFPR
jgi:hypothetical protein